MPTTHPCVLVAVSELSDKMSDDGDGRGRTSTDVGGLSRRSAHIETQASEL